MKATQHYIRSCGDFPGVCYRKGKIARGGADLAVTQEPLDHV
jgi:hypothetical protein